MANRVNNLINKMMLGKEKSEGYARSKLPSNRWELFWDIFKGRFWKLVIINILTLLFFIPFFLLIAVRFSAISSYGAYYPFSQGFGVGYLAAPTLVGYSENIIFNVNLSFLILLPVVLGIASIGISGGMYVIRNMVWTEGIFVANDFWRGIKQNAGTVFKIMFAFSIVVYLMILSISISDMSIVANPMNKTMNVITKIFAIIIIGFYSIMSLHMISMGVTYDLKFRQLLKNCFFFSIALLPQSIVFIGAGSLILLLLFLGENLIVTLGVVLSLFFGLSFFMLVWTVFTQWAFDQFLNDKVPGAKKNRGIYEKVKESDSESLKKYKEQVDNALLTTLRSRPIKPIDDDLKLEELPASFRREDILKLNASRQAIVEDHEKYVEAHKNDEQFVKFEQAKVSAEEEREKRIAKAKKELAKRNRNK